MALVLYEANDGFPRQPNRASLFFAFVQVAIAAVVYQPSIALSRPKPPSVEVEQDQARRLSGNDLYRFRTGYQTVGQPWQAFTRPRLPVIETEQDTARRRTWFYNPVTPTTSVQQPWVAYTRPALPPITQELDAAQRARPDLHLYRVGYQTVGQPWVAFTRPRIPIVEPEADTAQRHTQFYNVANVTTTANQPWQVYTRTRNLTIEAEQDTAQRRTWFYNQQPVYITGTLGVLAYQTTVLYEANDGFPRRPVDNTLLLFGRTAAVTPTVTQPFYAYNWGKPPTVATEEYSALRLRSDLNLYRVGYQTVGQPWNVFQWGKPPTVAAEEFTPRTPINFWSFVQPAPTYVTGTVAYLAYTTNVLYQSDSWTQPKPDYTALMFGRTTPITPNVYPWTAFGWTKPPTVAAEDYTVRTPYPLQSFFWKTPAVPPPPNAWFTLHWQQAVTVEAEQYRVTSPFPNQAFYWKSPYVPPPSPGTTIWDATYQVVNDNLMVYPIEWIMSATIPWGYVISRTPYPDSAQPTWTYIRMVASAGPPASPGYATVPNLVGLRSFDATSLLSTIGLISGTSTYVNSSTVAAGLVISQTVTAGTVVSTGTLVSVVLSLGTLTANSFVSVPTITNSTLAMATSTVVQSNLILLTPLYQQSNTVAAGLVISQIPAAGTTVDLWTPVSLVISSGPFGVPQTVTMPNLVGQLAATANATLSGAGLVPTSVTYGFQTSIATGVIVSQTVAAGSTVLVGTGVGYSVSSGPQPVTPAAIVPNVVGTTLTAARSAVVNANLVMGSPVYAASSTVYAETVISQNPIAGSVVSLWTTINLTVSSG